MKLVLLVLLGALWSGAEAATLTTNSCTTTAMDSAISSASNGDMVKLTDTDGTSPCTTTWSSALSSISKGITLDLNGSTITYTGSGSLFSVTANTTSGFRLTNGTLLGTDFVTVHGSATAKKFRFDHLTMTQNAGRTSIFFYVYGWGLIDHCTLSAPNNSEMIHNFGAMNGSGGLGTWTDDITPGSADALYVENSTFTNNGTSNASSAIQEYYGARYVFRHNTMNSTQVDIHGTAGMIGGRWAEIYDNTFNNPSGATQSDKFGDLRAGSGLVYGNTLGTGSERSGIVFREEDSGTWPLAYQPGSGYNGGTDQHSQCSGQRGPLADPSNTAPFYVWGNTGITITNGSGVQAGRDYYDAGSSQPSTLYQMEKSTDVCSTTYSYTPYPYPYPWSPTSVPPPEPPAALNVR